MNATNVLDTRFRLPDGIVLQDFPGETVALNLASGRFYGLNQTAAQVLRLLDTETPRNAALHVAQASGAPPERVLDDIERLIFTLLEHGLVTADA